MKYDNIIIGGGLSGLICGIKLAKSGKKVIIFTKGQSSLLFNSGSIDLLGYDSEGNLVESPKEALAMLPCSHPYCKLGSEATLQFAVDAVAILAEAGIEVKGTADKNHFRITPMGKLKPTWLTLTDYAMADNAQSLPYKKAILANIAGFLDFPIEFIAENLNSLGTECYIKSLIVDKLKERRMSPSEMRSANMAKLLNDETVIKQIADKLNSISSDAEAIYFPAIFGLDCNCALKQLKELVKLPLFTIATLPPSVGGARIQNALKKYFEKLGGTYVLGAEVTEGEVVDGKLKNIKVTTLPNETLEAKNYILATGSFQSGGLNSNYEKVFEPIWGLDVDAASNRPEWIDENVFESQPYMTFGVTTNSDLQVQLNGKTIENLYAVGSVLSGHNSIKMADGTGVSVITALSAAKSILNK